MADELAILRKEDDVQRSKLADVRPFVSATESVILVRSHDPEQANVPERINHRLQDVFVSEDRRALLLGISLDLLPNRLLSVNAHGGTSSARRDLLANLWQTPPGVGVYGALCLVDPTCHNPNTPQPATPLVSGPVIQLPGHHAKVRRGGYRTA
jgi:hypothetical protein